MKDKIKWPAGNRIDLCIPLRKITVTEEGTQFGEYIPSQAAVVMVYFVGNYASYEYTPRIEDNKLYITDNGELKPGVYAIDIRIQEPERKLRSFRCGELEIVRETRQLALGDFVLDNNITLDADAFIFGEGPSAFEVAVRDGYTGTKAEWLESMRGKEGRGIADIVALPTGAFRILLTDGSAYVTPILKGEQGVSIVDFTVSSITSQEVLCTITMSDGTTRTVNLPRGEKGEQGDAGEDGRGIQSVVMNNDYTITFSYTDGTSYTTPQSLRGEKGENGKDGQDGRGISSMSLDDDNHLTVSYTDGTTFTTPQSLQGERGVSITDFEQVGESATMCFFNIFYSNGNISQIGLPKGEQGDRGEQGPQGIKGDTVVLGEVGEYKLYNVGGTATDGAMTQDSTTKAIAAAAGYYECGTAAGTAAKVAVGDNEALYTLMKGGSIKVKMTNANAAASGVTLKIGSTAATPLYYNGNAVSASNSWEAGEVVDVYYDGTNYQATNAKVGSGKAADMKYDNSQSGLAANNVQGALDDIIQCNYPINLSAVQIGSGLPHVHSGKWIVDNYIRQHFIISRIATCNRLSVTASNTYASSISFLKSYSTPVNNASVPVCDSPLRCVVVPVGETAEFDIPYDCRYIIVMKSNSGIIQEPSAISQICTSEEVPVKKYDVAFNNFPSSANWVGINGNPVTTSGTSHYRIPLTGIKKIKITASAEQASYYTWASSLSESAVNGWVPLTAKRYDVPAGEEKEIDVPEGALYLMVGRTTANSVNFTPSALSLITQEGYIVNAFMQGVDTPVNISDCEELLGWLGNNGQLYRNNVGAAHFSIPIIGKSVTITPNSNNSYYCFASAVDGYNWTILAGETRNTVSSVSTIEIPDGAKYIVFGVRSSYASGTEYTPQSVVFHEELPEWITRMNAPKSPKLWRIMTYNIGHLNGGGVTAIDRRRKSSITDSDYDSKKEIALAICNQFKTDFVGVTEYPLDFAPFSASHSTETTREILFKRYWGSYIDLNAQDPAYIGDVNYDDYNAMFGRIPLLDLHKVEWNSELLADRFYMVGTGLLGECEVKIVLAHFGFNRDDMTDTTKQDIQVAELIAAFEQEHYVIIIGDLNLPSLSVLDPFVAAGYTLANGGSFGTFNTYRNNDGFPNNKALDHIIVKGFNIKSVYMVDNDLSDHNPFLADLEVI